jgi:hypothetical protein
MVKKWRARATHQLIDNAEITIRIEPATVNAIKLVHTPHIASN